MAKKTSKIKKYGWKKVNKDTEDAVRAVAKLTDGTKATEWTCETIGIRRGLRDDFAQAAMVELIRKLPYMDTARHENDAAKSAGQFIKQVYLMIAHAAYDYADAMLAVRALSGSRHDRPR